LGATDRKHLFWLLRGAETKNTSLDSSKLGLQSTGHSNFYADEAACILMVLA